MADPHRLERENEELRRHLELLLKTNGIVLRLWREGKNPEPVFVDSLEEVVGRASAALLTMDAERER